MGTETPAGRHRATGRAKLFLRANGLSLVLCTTFVLLLAAQAVVGLRVLNTERAEHGSIPLTMPQYLATGDFVEVTAENWESEFLQMAAYILLTVSLFQKGSSESKKLEGGEAVDVDPRSVKGKADRKSVV